MGDRLYDRATAKRDWYPIGIGRNSAWCNLVGFPRPGLDAGCRDRHWQRDFAGGQPWGEKPAVRSEPQDPLPLFVACGAFCITALAAGVLPAWRASRLDPMATLRAE